MIAREFHPTPDAETVFVLVHLDDIEIFDERILAGDTDDYSYGGYPELAAAVAQEVHRLADGCGRRICVVYNDYDDETQEGDLPWHEIGGRSRDDWEFASAERDVVARVVGKLVPNGSRVIVAGAARRDCVARVARTLDKHGCQVILADTAVAPLTNAADQAVWAGIHAARQAETRLAVNCG